MQTPKPCPDYAYEDQCHAEGHAVVCGVDEAGRGPLCGPVCAAAVILPSGLSIPGLNDSKKLSESKREKLYGEICASCISYGVAYASPEEIDAYNILNATMLAMNRAISQLSPAPDIALIDGNCKKGIDYNALCIVKGDGKSMSVAAASVLAKVSRDRLMRRLAEQYPMYRLETHKGYPTAEHIRLLRAYGPCEIYRRSFLRKILGDSA